jgi:DNA-binding CsgD family transcriptional regulator
VSLLDGVQQALSQHVPADRWCAMTLDPATNLPTGGVHAQGLSAHRMPRLLELEFARGDVNTLSELARSRSPAATLSAATGGHIERSTRLRDVLLPDGIKHELRAVFRDPNGVWAAIVLMRGGDVGDFDATDTQLLAQASEPVARALRRLLLLAEANAPAHPDAPALVLLDGGPHPGIAHASATAAHWLEMIDDRGSASELPLALCSLALRARAEGSATVRLRIRTGRWLTAHAERVGGSSQVSVILQPSRPHEVAQVLSAAYGLTPREAEVARLVAAGCSNPEIAGLLFVSRYTVQDHLKHVFEKLAVGSRSELVARLFFDQYLPRTTAEPKLDANGWFRPESGRRNQSDTR